jgi:hypothetical protein
MAAYNRAIWPVQVALTLAALTAVWVAFRRAPDAGRLVTAVLAVLWAWMAIAYHWAYFTTINKAAWAFGALCLAGAAAFAWWGVRRKAVHVEAHPGAVAAFGWVLIAFALLVYPAVGKLLGHDYPATPTFGLPCPTTIFTIGMLMLMTPSTPRWLYIAPLLWTLVGSTAAFLLGVYQDLGLVVAGLAGVWAMSRSRPPGSVELQLGR